LRSATRAASPVVMPIVLAKLPTAMPACISGALYDTTCVKRVANGNKIRVKLQMKKLRRRRQSARSLYTL
jgi:hypothetical protein